MDEKLVEEMDDWISSLQECAGDLEHGVASNSQVVEFLRDLAASIREQINTHR
jgi:hypothetical protein